jgi:hypothetical protein
MIPIDAPNVSITAHLFFDGKFAAEIEGCVYSCEDCPAVDVVTLYSGGGIETEVMNQRYLSDADNAVAQALIAESKTVFTQARLEEAFRDWHEGRREAAREHAGELRRVG